MTPPVTTLDEICILISAQLDILEDPTPLTASQLVELHSRAETIRLLCNELAQVNGEEPELQAEADAFLGENDQTQEFSAQPFEFRTRRVRALAELQVEEERHPQLAAAA